MTRIIGDIHGEWEEYHQSATDSPDNKSIQIGDFGVGFAGPFWHDRVNDFHSNHDHRFIRGNHDDPQKCKNDMVGYIPDGMIENNTMFIGGAWSIDWEYRAARMARGGNTCWWEDEECSIDEFTKLIDIYRVTQPKIMITHDAPLDITEVMFVKAGLAMGGIGAKSIKTKTGQALNAMFEIHQPDFWFFGHWHCDKVYFRNGTTFICLGIHSWIDIDLDTMEITDTNSSTFEGLIL